MIYPTTHSTLCVLCIDRPDHPLAFGGQQASWMAPHVQTGGQVIVQSQKTLCMDNECPARH